MVEQVVTRMTAAEFLELPESNQITELIDGEVSVSPAPLIDHQNVVLETAVILRGLIPDGRVYIAPSDVYFDDINVVQPDIFWISDKNERCIAVGRKHFRGAPDLIVEVLSSGTTRIDRKTKFNLYEKYGVREYWMVEPIEQYVEVWVRDGEKFVRLGLFEPHETFTSPLLGEIIVKQMF